MPTKSKVIGFSAARMKRDMMKIVVTEQTDRLVEYAMAKIGEIGDRIQEYHSANHMDHRHNLLDSLCWGVTYRGEMKASGFYRDQMASEPSQIHEWFHAETPDYKQGGKWIKLGTEQLDPIWGHQMAERYLQKGGKTNPNGWTVFFAILAPYWGYWEEGFRMVAGFGQSARFLQFSVMTEYYDVVKRDLAPAKVDLKVHVERYTNTGLAKKAKRGYNRNNW